jgi:hypothetical protein
MEHRLGIADLALPLVDLDAQAATLLDDVGRQAAGLRDRLSISLPSAISGTRAVRSPARTRSAARIRCEIGVARLSAKLSPTQTAASNSNSATTPKITAKVT